MRQNKVDLPVEYSGLQVIKNSFSPGKSIIVHELFELSVAPLSIVLDYRL